MQIKCSQCGYIAEENSFETDKRCPVCHFKNNFRISIMDSPSLKEDKSSEEEHELIPVETHDDFGLEDFFHTFLNLLRFPRSFFSQIPHYDRLLRPFLIAFFINWIVAGILLLTSGIGHFSFIDPLIEKFPEMEIVFASNYFRLFFFIFFPILFMASNIIMASIFHFLLKISFIARESFGQTLRLFFYINYLELIKIIPLIGVFISGILRLVYLIWGIKTIHRLTWLQIFILSLVIGSAMLLMSIGAGILIRLMV